MNPESPAISIRDAGYRYRRSTAPVLEHVTLDVPAFEHLALIGRSGCGKSTLLRLIGGLACPQTGTVQVLGATDEAGRLAACALMPQNDLLLPWFDLAGNVAIGLRNQGVPRRRARSRALGALSQLGLSEWAGARPDALSGGMRQRASLARALLAGKPVLLADEPLGALDAITRAEGQKWLRDAVTGASTTLVMVTHDVEEALLLSRRVVLLAGRPGCCTGSWPGWFDDDRPHEEILADPEFGASRTAILGALGRVRQAA
ncbi:ABC transporter ATP-binding protein [Acidipropionibacterium virtanenii]|uniref:Bicarbonate transport ATP-binding protein CmpD n=1 Tax=Acidipropionibacterium virtanenii TaxID=2057246 RepID=A0A344UTZ0_9ACTN|nr:ATP-binding cassette domain-containing protein [Acidipropionibacterium virtanenii]AXE38738.1 Bicarbonate transport ATP-binding protein CmpD [Acidipropionibacterium virtanenii]